MFNDKKMHVSYFKIPIMRIMCIWLNNTFDYVQPRIKHSYIYNRVCKAIPENNALPIRNEMDRLISVDVATPVPLMLENGFWL